MEVLLLLALIAGVIWIFIAGLAKDLPWLRDPASPMGKTLRHLGLFVLAAIVLYAAVPAAYREAPAFLRGFSENYWKN